AGLGARQSFVARRAPGAQRGPSPRGCAPSVCAKRKLFRTTTGTLATDMLVSTETRLIIVDDRARKQYGRKSNPQQKPKLKSAFPADDTETRDKVGERKSDHEMPN